jgi:hypothetical protein
MPDGSGKQFTAPHNVQQVGRSHRNAPARTLTASGHETTGTEAIHTRQYATVSSIAGGFMGHLLTPDQSVRNAW